MLLFKARPTTLHKKYSYVVISDDFHLRVEGTEYGTNIALVTSCHTKVFIDRCLNLTKTASDEDVCWDALTYDRGVLGSLTKDEVLTILGGLPLMLLNAAMYKVSLL